MVSTVVSFPDPTHIARADSDGFIYHRYADYEISQSDMSIVGIFFCVVR